MVESWFTIPLPPNLVACLCECGHREPTYNWTTVICSTCQKGECSYWKPRRREKALLRELEWVRTAIRADDAVRARAKKIREKENHMAKVRAICKFRVASVEGDEENQTVKLHTLYREDDPEDTKFSKYTPWGNMEFGLSNPNLMGQFKVGDDFYITLESCDDVE
jgi:hypothetical protein